MNYYILCTGRTGSTLLYKYLKQLGLGHPCELANDDILPPEKRTFEGLKQNLEARRVGNCCGAKVSWGTLDYISKTFSEDINVYNLLYDLTRRPAIYLSLPPRHRWASHLDDET